MSLGLTAGRRRGRERAEARRRQIASVQQTMELNRRFDVLADNLPLWGTDNNVELLTAFATSDLSDDEMLDQALALSSEDMLASQVEMLENMGGDAGEAVFSTYATSMQDALRAAGYTPKSEQGGLWDKLTSAPRIPLTGRIGQAINWVPRALGAGRIVSEKNWTIPETGVAPANVAVQTINAPFRAVGMGIDAAFAVFDTTTNFMNRIYETGYLLRDRYTYLGEDENGDPIYSRGREAEERLTSQAFRGLPFGDAIAGFGGAVAKFDFGGLKQAWGDSRTQPYTMHGVAQAADALGADVQQADTWTSDLWLAMQRANGQDLSEILANSGITTEDPGYLERAQQIMARLATEEMQSAVQALGYERADFGLAKTREAGIDPDSTLGKWSVGINQMAFDIGTDPFNVVGAGITRFRYATRWKVGMQASTHVDDVQRYREIIEYVREADRLAEVEGVSRRAKIAEMRQAWNAQPRFYSWQRIRQGSDVRQARRTMNWIDNVADGFKRYDELIEAGDEAAAAQHFGQMMDEIPGLVGAAQPMRKWHFDQKRYVRKHGVDAPDLTTADGVLDFMQDQIGRRVLLTKRIGGVRRDVQVIPQMSRTLDKVQATKAVFRRVTDPARSRGQRGLARLGTQQHEYRHITDVKETMEKIAQAESRGAIEVADRSLIQRLRNQRLTVKIDGEDAPLDVDELLNWTIDTSGGAARRFVRAFVTHTPKATRLNVAGDDAVAEFRSFIDMGGLAHMSQSTLNEYVGRFAAGNVAERTLIVNEAITDMFRRTGFVNFDTAGNEVLDRFVRKTKQKYGVRDDLVPNMGRQTEAAIWSKQTDTVIQIPNFKELADATKAMNRNRMMFGAVNPGWADRFIQQIWSPLQLMRIGFIPRAAGEEMLAWALRGNPMDIVRAKSTLQAAGMQRNRSTQLLEPITDANRVLTVYRPFARVGHLMGNWTGVRGHRLLRDAKIRAHARVSGYKQMSDVDRLPVLRQQIDELLAERSKRNFLFGEREGWAFKMANRGANGINRFMLATKGMPTKQAIYERLARMGAKPLEGAIAKRFPTEYELRVHAAKLMAADPVVSRAFAELAGGLVDPYVMQANDVMRGRNVHGVTHDASYLRHVVMSDPADTEEALDQVLSLARDKYDISNYVNYERTADATEFFMAMSMKLAAHKDDASASAIIRVVNDFVGDDTMARLEPILASRTSRVSVERELIDMPDDVASELARITTEASDQEAALRVEFGNIVDTVESFAPRDVENLRLTLDGLHGRIAAERKNLEDLEALKAAADDDEWRRAVDAAIGKTREIEEAVAQADELAELLELVDQVMPQLDEIGALRAEAASISGKYQRVPTGDGDYLEIGSTIDSIRTEYAQLPPAVRREVEAVFDGELANLDPDTVLKHPFAEWMVNHRAQIGRGREYSVLFETPAGRPVYRSTEEMRTAARRAAELELRSYGNDTLTTMMRAALDENGDLVRGPSEGMQFSYAAVVDQDLIAKIPEFWATDGAREAFIETATRKLIDDIGMSQEQARSLAINFVTEAGMRNRAAGMQANMGDMGRHLAASLVVDSNERVMKILADELDTALRPFAEPGPYVPASLAQLETPLDLPKKPTPAIDSVTGEEMPLSPWLQAQADEAEQIGMSRQSVTSGGDVTYVEPWTIESARLINPDKARRLHLVEDADGTRRWTPNLGENQSPLDTIYSDLSDTDFAFTRLAERQVDDILDTLTTFKRGRNEVLNELAAPSAHRKTHLTDDEIMGRAVAEDLPHHMLGPTLVREEDLTVGSWWNAVKRGAFDEVISPAINSIVRQPMFLDLYTQAIAQNYDLRRMYDLSDGFLEEFMEEYPHTLTQSMVDDMIEMAWDLGDDSYMLEPGSAERKLHDLKRAIVDDQDLERSVELLGLTIDESELGRIRAGLIGKRMAHEEMRTVAMEQTLKNVTPFIDDHRVRSQFQQHIGGIMPFWFAEEQFLKRWARGFYENPLMLHKLHITLGGFRNMGFIQQDSYGNDVIVWPMSEHGVEFMVDAWSKVPIFGGDALAIEAAPLSTDLNFILPGVNSDAPEGISMFGPGVAFQVNMMTTHFPELSMYRDQLLGDMSANRWDPDSEGADAIFDHFVPSMYRNLYRAFVADADEASLASAQLQAMQYLIANDLGPPEGDPLAQQEFMDRTTETARVIMMMRAATSFVGGTTASPMYDAGPQQFFRELLNAGIPYTDAVDAIVAVHGGDARVYTVFGSASESGAPIPSTADALEYMQEHEGLLNQFSSAAPWFIPQDRPENGEFGILERRARNQAIANELRIQRSPEEWLRSVYTATAAGDYFTSRDGYLQQRLALKANGRDDMVEQLDFRWDAWKTSYLAQHPVFAAEISTPEGQIRRAETMRQFEQMLAADLIPDTPQAEALRPLIVAAVEFQQAMDSIKGERSPYAQDLRDRWRRQLYLNAERYVQTEPLGEVFFSSVIRPLIGTEEIAEIEFS